MSRRERAIEAALDDLTPKSSDGSRRTDLALPSYSEVRAVKLAVQKYEAELAADLESEEMVQLALDAAQGLPGFYERGQRVGLGSMRAALRTVLEE